MTMNNAAMDSFMRAVQHQRTATDDSAIASGELSREATEDILRTPPRGPRAPTVETPASQRRATAAAAAALADGGAVELLSTLPAVQCDSPSQRAPSLPSSSESDEDLNTTNSEFVATRMFFNNTHINDDASPIAKLPAVSGVVDEVEPDARAPASQGESAMNVENDEFSPLVRPPTFVAAERCGEHAPVKTTAPSNELDESAADCSDLDRSTRPPPREDSEFFFVDNHDGTGYLTSAARQDDGSYLLGQTVLLAQSRASFAPELSQSACATRTRLGAASPVVVPPSANASPLPHQVRLREDAAAEVSTSDLDLGATQNLMLNHSFADGTVLGSAGRGGEMNASFSSFASPSISRIIARANNDRACGATPQRPTAPNMANATTTKSTRSAAPARPAGKQLTFDSSFALDSSFTLLDQTLLGQSLCTNLGAGESGYFSPLMGSGSPLPRRQRGVGPGAAFGASASMSGAASPVPDAPTEEPYVVREARAEREAGVDRVYVQPPTQDVTLNALSERGWVPVFVDFRRKASDYEISPTSRSPIPNDPLHETTNMDTGALDMSYVDDLHENDREASLSRIDTLDCSFASSGAGLDQTVLNNISRRLSLSVTSVRAGGNSCAGSPRCGVPLNSAFPGSAIPPSTPLGQIMRRQSSSSVWGAQSPVPTAPADASGTFEREGSPSRAPLTASVSIGQQTQLSDLLTSMSVQQRPTGGSSDWYATSNTAFLSNTDGSFATATTPAMSLSGQPQTMLHAVRRRVSNATMTTNSTHTTTTTSAASSQAASMGLGGRSAAQSIGLGSSFRVTHCKRASMGPTMLKGAMPLSRGQLSASTSTSRVHADPAHAGGRYASEATQQQQQQQQAQPQRAHHNKPAARPAMNRGHQLDCATPIRRTTLEKPDTSVFVPWSPLTITPESSLNCGVGWNAAGPFSMDGGASPCSPPRAGQSTATAPGISPDKHCETATTEKEAPAVVPAREMAWVPFTASLTTNTTSATDAGASAGVSCADSANESRGQQSLSLAASGLSPSALEALRNGIAAAVQQQLQDNSAHGFDMVAGRSAAVEREDAPGAATMSQGVETFPASLMSATVMDVFSNMDSAATSAMMQSIALFAAQELQHENQNQQSEESEPEPRLSSAVVASIAQRWVAEQQRTGKENCTDSVRRSLSAGVKQNSASPSRQPSLSARAPSEVNTNRDSHASS